MKKISLIDKAFILKNTPLFSKLDLDLLLPIADKLAFADFDQDDVIFSLSEEAHRMYFIVKGRVAIKDASKKMIAKLSVADFFGDESIFNEQPRGYEATCLENTRLLALSKTNLLTIISECPSVAIGLLQAYTLMTPFRFRKSEEL